MTRCAVVLSALLLAASVASSDAGELSVETPAAAARELLSQDETRELFLRCCWARGRAGFHYCAQYGLCKSDPEADCVGVGAAEGMSASCKTEPPDLPDESG